jgi:hypothetical protein
MAAPEQSLRIRANACNDSPAAATFPTQKNQANKSFKLDLQSKVPSQCSQHRL